MVGLTRLRAFLPALYAVAALLVVAPLTEMVGAAGVVRPNLATWRFGVIGLGLNALVAQTLGLALGLAVAAALEHRRTLRAASIVACLLAMLTVMGVARFLLDLGQLQSAIAPAERTAFDAAAFHAVMLASLTVPVLVVLGGKGLRASRTVKPEARTPALPHARVIPFPGRERAPDPRWPR